jgi:hypothetical protein
MAERAIDRHPDKLENLALGPANIRRRLTALQARGDVRRVDGERNRITWFLCGEDNG